jgi:hypothetical protein
LPDRTTRRRVLRTFATAAGAWAIAVAWMWTAADPARLDPDSRRYGANWPGDLERGIATSTVEVLVLWLLLRPWSAGSLVRRLLLAAALLMPYVAFRLLAGLHSGPIGTAHDFWLLGVWSALPAAAVYLAGSALIRRNRPSPPA